MAAHDLDDESTRVRGGGGFDVVDHLANAGQGRVAANGGVGAGEVIVDGADDADNVEVLVGGHLFRGQLARGDELVEQRGPLGAEPVGTSQGAVSSADDEGVDAMEHHVLGGRHATASLEKGQAPGRADERASLGQPAAHVVPLHLLDVVAAADQALVAFVDGKGVAAHVDGHAHDGAHDAVHARGVTPGGHDGDLLLRGHGGTRVASASGVGVGAAESSKRA